MAITTLPTLSQYFTVFSILWNRQLTHNYYANRTPLPPNNAYDFIVVGAGSAGSIVACRLAQWGQNVLLLEAGGAVDAIMSDYPGMFVKQLGEGSLGIKFWPYLLTPQRYVAKAYINGQLPEWKGKGLGGGSSVNFMLYVRPNRRDFDNMADNYGAKGWSYDEVLPLFKRTENNSNYFNNTYHGNDGPMGVTSPPLPDPIQLIWMNSLKDEGIPIIDTNGETQLGQTLLQTTIKNGLRSGTANAFLESGICPTLTIVTRALVTKVLIESNTNGIPFASGVEFIKNNKTYSVKANKEVILSAGNKKNYLMDI